MILDNIKKPNDIHKIPLEQFPALAEEIRRFLIESISKTGGHLGSNLGVVELTMALHNVMHFPEDKLIWDVGHQAYTHKILTGRKDAFSNLRKEGGLSGFPKRSESDCDSFDTGHSSTSVSAGVGYVKARELTGGDYRVVSVIGDGALTGGMAYEALNNASTLKSNFIIVLNDNNMSISKSVGGMSSYLANIRTAEAYTGLKMNVTKTLNKIPKVGAPIVKAVRSTKSGIKQLIIPGMLFENMGLTYLGPVDGHDMHQMMKLFNEAKRVDGPVVVHVLTQKGRGYDPAVRHPARFHGTTAFEIETGLPVQGKGKETYTDVFSTVMRKLGERQPKLAAITAAMPTGTGLKRFANMFPERFFDVGIAEEHAVTFAAGLALGGIIPVLAVYSSFLQRGFDQLIHDVCMQNLHVVFAIDRAGLVGSDGETHQGCFDLSYLAMIPNMTVMAPKNKWELSDMIKFAVAYNGPVAVRYPRGTAYDGLEECRDKIVLGKAERIHKGSQVAVVALGSMVEMAQLAYEKLTKEEIRITMINARFVKPLDTSCLDKLAAEHHTIITVEENVRNGGFGQRVSDYMLEHHPDIAVHVLAIEDCFVEQGNVADLRRELGLDGESIAAVVKEYWK
ncbi:MAG: 1-deoxy-D-xylulose-5-phosphate synthase [Eubacteriales bacterium]|nr:1-deoxy-D-xylulose-5-phosphate synthase [Eubacteriales bacterium]